MLAPPITTRTRSRSFTPKPSSSFQLLSNECENERENTSFKSATSSPNYNILTTPPPSAISSTNNNSTSFFDGFSPVSQTPQQPVSPRAPTFPTFNIYASPNKDNNLLPVPRPDSDKATQPVSPRTGATGQVNFSEYPAPPRGVAVGLLGPTVVNTVPTQVAAPVVTLNSPTDQSDLPLAGVATSPAALAASKETSLLTSNKPKTSFQTDLDHFIEFSAPAPLGSNVTVFSAQPKPKKGTDAEPLIITDIEATIGGPMGLVYTEETYYHHSQICYRFTIHGLSCNETGAARVEFILSVTDAFNGKVMMRNVQSFTPTLFMGSNELFAYVTYTISADNLEYGRYTLNLQITDLNTLKNANLSRSFNFEKTNGVTISRITFFKDKLKNDFGALSGFIGESSYFRLGVVGFQANKIINAKMAFNIREQTSATLLLEKPITSELKESMVLPKGASKDEASNQAALIVISFAGHFNLTRLGNYYLCITIQDKVSNQTVVKELPFTVYKP